MGKNCCGPVEDVEANNDPLWRRILWIALILNAVMFSVEIVAGLAADSRALQADALDFLGDAANYAISLCVAGMALAWRACARGRPGGARRGRLPDERQARGARLRLMQKGQTGRPLGSGGSRGERSW